MLTRSQLAEISRREGVPLHTVERDYVQHLLLRSLEWDRVVFKGGTNLRIVLGSPRYSEDLDFNVDGDDTEAEELFSLAVARLEAYGLRARLDRRRSMADSFLGRVRYEGPLFDGRAQSRGTIRLDGSLRGEEVAVKEAFVPRTPYPDVYQLVLRVLEDDHLFAEKVRALLVRKKARDLYDLHFLLQRSIDCPPFLVDRKMAIYGRSFTYEGLEESVRLVRGTWERDLGPLLGQVPPYRMVAEEVLSAFRRRWSRGH
ncbi:MAG: nucleotidyl transferase AbiEii/AbiGii toxin family protein [Thermoplasmata archaeon]